MFKISEFATLMGVTAKALRFYEAQGLLLPTKVDDDNGYRYYSSDQIKDLSLIIQLKRLGFSLNEVKAFKDNKISVAEKMSNLEYKKTLIDEMLLHLSFQDKSSFKYSPYIKVEHRIPVVRRAVVAHDYLDLLKAYVDFYDDVTSKCVTLRHPEYCYIEFTDDTFRMNEIGAVMGIGLAKESRAVLTEIKEECTYVAVIHQGGYDTMQEAYKFLDEYVALQKLQVVGNPTERYLESYGSKSDSDEYITEVRYPVLLEKRA